MALLHHNSISFETERLSGICNMAPVWSQHQKIGKYVLVRFLGSSGGRGVRILKATLSKMLSSRYRIRAEMDNDTHRR